MMTMTVHMSWGFEGDKANSGCGNGHVTVPDGLEYRDHQHCTQEGMLLKVDGVHVQLGFVVSLRFQHLHAGHSMATTTCAQAAPLPIKDYLLQGKPRPHSIQHHPYNRSPYAFSGPLPPDPFILFLI